MNWRQVYKRSLSHSLLLFFLFHSNVNTLFPPSLPSLPYTYCTHSLLFTCCMRGGCRCWLQKPCQEVPELSLKSDRCTATDNIVPLHCFYVNRENKMKKKENKNPLHCWIIRIWTWFKHTLDKNRNHLAQLIFLNPVKITRHLIRNSNPSGICTFLASDSIYVHKNEKISLL